MRRLLVWFVVCAGCGGDGGSGDPIADQLADLPGVTVEASETARPGYQFYVLRFEQPIDHANPDGPKFQQRVSLLHKGAAAPMVALTSGYWDFYGDRIYELTGLLAANQISIEHRYFGESRPENPDWSKLTIRQMANDEHDIITKLRTVYSGAFVTTGGSKGGMTAVYHRRFFPDDVEATVPYVAPISFGAPDARYVPFLDTLGPEACRVAVRAAATELLANRRAAMLAQAQAQADAKAYHYERLGLGPALEAAITSVEWTFWQYAGVDACGDVPATSASDDAFWAFLDDVSPVSDNSDARLAQFEAYYYQAYAQLGFPDAVPGYLEPYLLYTDRDYDASLPTAMPPYDRGEAMADIDLWVRTAGSRLMFIYGEWDPWTGGKFELGAATDSAVYIEPRGNHGAQISALHAWDRDEALAKLATWTGTQARRRAAVAEVAEFPEPRIPGAMLRALRSR